MTDIYDRYTRNDDAHTTASTALAGLVPTHTYTQPGASFELREPSKLAKSMLATMPIILVGTAVAMNLTGPVERVEARTPSDRNETTNGTATTDVGAAVKQALENAGHTAGSTEAELAAEVATVAPAAVPATYRVASGDTVSSIAGRHGLATASVLALNGLGWSSLIFPGQVLQLVKGGTATPVTSPAPTPAPSTGSTYTIVKGDTVSGIASRHGVSTQAVLTANGITASTIIYPGRTLTIPGAATAAPAPVVQAPVAETPVVSAPVTPAPVVAPPAVVPVTNGTYVIRSGDTLTRIAANAGVTLQDLLNANGLTVSSIIYSGRTLVIPGATAVPAANAGGAVLLTAEGEGHARTIIAVGRELGVSDYGIVIALATAMQESTMRNLTWGDRDSVGLFQQRPSSGWGSVEQLTTPAHAARLFYGGPSNPNKGNTRGLLDIAGWQSMSVTVAAQKVQISAYPDAYAKWETSARYWLSTLG